MSTVTACVCPTGCRGLLPLILPGVACRHPAAAWALGAPRRHPSHRRRGGTLANPSSCLSDLSFYPSYPVTPIIPIYSLPIFFSTSLAGQMRELGFFCDLYRIFPPHRGCSHSRRTTEFYYLSFTHIYLSFTVPCTFPHLRKHPLCASTPYAQAPRGCLGLSHITKGVLARGRGEG